MNFLLYYSRLIVYVGVCLGLVLLGASCKPSGGNNHIAADGYRFEPTERLLRDPAVRVVTYRTRAEFLASYMAQGGSASKRDVLMAFAAYNVERNTCTIYAMDPAVQYQPEFLGHELAHCLYGNFHPQQDRERAQ